MTKDTSYMMYQYTSVNILYTIKHAIIVYILYRKMSDCFMY